MGDEQIETVMQALQFYWMSDEENCGEAVFNKWAEKHHMAFEDGFEFTEDNEGKLEYTVAHQDFVKLFENEIGQVIEKTGVDTPTFLEALKKDLDNEENQFYV